MIGYQRSNIYIWSWKWDLRTSYNSEAFQQDVDMYTIYVSQWNCLKKICQIASRDSWYSLTFLQILRKGWQTDEETEWCSEVQSRTAALERKIKGWDFKRKVNGQKGEIRKETSKKCSSVVLFVWKCLFNDLDWEVMRSLNLSRYYSWV